MNLYFGHLMMDIPYLQKNNFDARKLKSPKFLQYQMLPKLSWWQITMILLMYNNIMVSGRRGHFLIRNLLSITFKRGILIEIPKVTDSKSDATENAESKNDIFRFPMKTRQKKLSHIIYEVPRIKPSNSTSIADIEESVSKVMKLLDIGPASLSNQESNVKLSIPIFEKPVNLDTLPPIYDIPKFEFKIEDYPISEKELADAPSEFQVSRYPPVTTSTPLCTDYTRLKGVHGDLFLLTASYRIDRVPSVHKCKWFFLNYFHGDHFLARIRKSRPGVLVTTNNNNFLNTSKISEKIPEYLQNFGFPFKSSVYRSKCKKLVRKYFLDIYLEDMEFANGWDGLYKFNCNIYPKTDEELKDFQKEIRKALEKVGKLDKRRLHSDAIKVDQRLPWKDINSILSKVGLPSMTAVDHKRKIIKTKKNSTKERKVKI